MDFHNFKSVFSRIFLACSRNHNVLYTAKGCFAMLQHSLDSCALVTCTAGLTIPSVFTPHARASERFWEVFTVNIRNRNARQAYYHAVSQFARWCEVRVIHDLATVRPMQVAAHIEHRLVTASKPTVKQQLAAIRALFDWVVVGQAMEMNPAASVRDPKYSVRKGKTLSGNRLASCWIASTPESLSESVTGPSSPS